MSSDSGSTWYLSRRLFLGGIALVYGIAFASLAVQVQGLYGANGLAPIAGLLERAQARVAWYQAPSVLWWGASDGALLAWCWGGVGLAGLALLGLVPRLALAALWAIYLSFVTVGDPFLSFQWDVLLLEAGLVAVVWAPDGLRPFGYRERAPSNAGRWLVYALLFKLMALSGLVKLTSGDPAWRDGTALDYHYWTQPLPHRLSVVASDLPEWTRLVALLAMFAIELGVPLLLVFPWGRRGCRQVAAVATWLLMGAIVATGNYGFFNLLTAVLCLPLLDDRAWSWARARLRRLARRPAAPELVRDNTVPEAWRGFLLTGVAALYLVLSAERVAVSLGVRHVPPPIDALREHAAPFQSCNAYGLFRVMTRERPEIRLEASEDGGATWEPYGFRYKPLELDRPPVFAGLHMPRLDWQLWFAALDPGTARAPWFQTLLARLLEGAPEVQGLLRSSPFEGRRPPLVRAMVSPYRFASPSERAAGQWWTSGELETYAPPVQLPGR